MFLCATGLEKEGSSVSIFPMFLVNLEEVLNPVYLRMKYFEP